LLLPLALASRSPRRGLTPRSLPAWTALVSPRNLACRVRHQSNDPVVVQEFQPDVHRSPPVKVRLRPDSPVADHPCDGTLGLPVVGVRTPLLCYSFRHSLSIPLHGGLALPLHHDIDAPLPCRQKPTSCASARRFAPLDYRRIGTRPVSCYALFQGWLLLSQPPGCLRPDTSFTTQRRFGGLSGRSGLFPSRRTTFAPHVSLQGQVCGHSEFAVAW
jgi:hypothetical protein